MGGAKGENREEWEGLGEGEGGERKRSGSGHRYSHEATVVSLQLSCD